MFKIARCLLKFPYPSLRHFHKHLIRIQPPPMSAKPDQPKNKAKRKCCPLRRSRKGCMKGKGGPENPSCTYRGVRQRTWGKWVAEIREPDRGARLWLGTFSSSLEAAQAYDIAARSLYGDCARLNLPNESPSAPAAAAAKPTEIAMDDLDEYVMSLPKAEDFGLDAFREMEGDLMDLGALQLSWCS